MALDDMLDDGETEPGAAGLPASRRVDAIEALGHARQMLAWNARAVIGDRQRRPGPAARRRQANLRAGPGAPVAHRIAEQIVDYLEQLRPVASHRGQVGGDVDYQLTLRSATNVRGVGGRAFDHVVEENHVPGRYEAVGFDARQAHQVLDD